MGVDPDRYLPHLEFLQGTVLGPFLFLIYINNLSTLLTTECSIFADDTTAYCVGRETNITRLHYRKTSTQLHRGPALGECCLM